MQIPTYKSAFHNDFCKCDDVTWNVTWNNKKIAYHIPITWFSQVFLYFRLHFWWKKKKNRIKEVPYVKVLLKEKNAL